MSVFAFTSALPAAGRVRSDAAGATSPEATVRETRWVRLARNGDPDAFRRLVELHQDAAYETALRIVRSPEEAEEAAQDAFVRAWRALPGFREEARFSTWLTRIVIRRALDGVRARDRRRTREATTEPRILEERGAPSRTALPLPDRLRLDRVLGRLDPTRRAVVTLFYLREHTIDEVAAALDLPPGTVKSHLHRARRTMRDAWRREGRDSVEGLPPEVGS
jgi:RNA polymerase sigma-70 factor (ECF subfamily)